jgi:hypothetical protein
MADTQDADDRREVTTGAGTGRIEAWRAARDTRRVTRLAREISAFAGAHGGAEGQIAYLGRTGARIALVGADGRWGNLVAPSHLLAQQAVEKAGITVHEDFAGEFAARVRTGRYEWTRMAGIQLGGRRHGERHGE